MILTPIQKAKTIQQLELLLAQLKTLKPHTPCNLCVYFLRGNCSVYQADVPAEFQAVGCEKFEDDVPF